MDTDKNNCLFIFITDRKADAIESSEEEELDYDLEYQELPINPFAELQDEFEKEVRASLVTCWLAIPETDED